jgi:hypothetical protein
VALGKFVGSADVVEAANTVSVPAVPSSATACAGAVGGVVPRNDIFVGGVGFVGVTVIAD